MAGPPRLRIRDVQARAVVAPLATPVRTASGAVTEALLVLIDLHTEEGPIGRAYLFAYQALALRPLRDLVRGLGETVKGHAVAPVDLDRAMRGRFTLFGGARGLQGMAVAGIDMAAWDALAVVHRRSVGDPPRRCAPAHSGLQQLGNDPRRRGGRRGGEDRGRGFPRPQDQGRLAVARARTWPWCGRRAGRCRTTSR